jgi:hypothetical protein
MIKLRTNKLTFIDFTEKDFDKVLHEINRHGNVPMFLYAVMHNQAVLMKSLEDIKEMLALISTKNK